MFEPAESPRVFALPPGADFPGALVAGLLQRMAGQPPEALARVTLHVNTARMQRRIRTILAESGARLLPRIRLVTELGQSAALAGVPPAVPPLRRRLELAQLVDGLLQREPDLAPRAALYDLADSLARLMDEMQGEGVAPEVLAALDVTEHSKHWERSLRFIRLVQGFFGPAAAAAPDREARQRMVVEQIAASWAKAPPADPVIVAGSTGSRGTTALFMQAVARLPQGALVLPGFDFDMPAAVWDGLGDALAAEDHPQFRFHALLQRLGLGPGDVRPWSAAPAPCPPRNRLVSLALRPAPVTDQWMTEGRNLRGLDAACAAVTLIEAPSPRMEAQAIALRLRKAAEDGQRAALITPDRNLTRQVTAALDAWGIIPDDSAGRPLALSAPGRFLRHVAALFGHAPGAEALLVLLKHPLTHSAGGRNAHLLNSRELELWLRKKAQPFPDAALLEKWAADKRPEAAAWAAWLGGLLTGLENTETLPLAEHVARHVALAEGLAAGPEGAAPGELWQKEAGREARLSMAELEREAPHGGMLSARDYADFVAAILQARQVREPVQAHPGIMIWGTLEARVQGADLVILAGLNEGIWPQSPAPDPWLNRRMRFDAGLLLPERQIGLAAHDFQQAIAAPEVVLSRAERDADAQTVPSRWLNRLLNLLQGLPEVGGPAACAEMRARGRDWLQLAQALDADFSAVPQDAATPAPRPAPRPPLAARPRELPVTAITRLIRDPYAVYARYVLGLRKLRPLHPSPDALLRGTVLHAVIEEFVRDGGLQEPQTAHRRLMDTAARVLVQTVPWPAARELFQARLARAAPWYLDWEARAGGTPVLLEEPGAVDVPETGFRLTARPDRIDALEDGALLVIDYKTGAPPSATQQRYFDKQLLLEAAMAERGAFSRLGPRPVARISYLGLGTNPKEETTDITEAMLEQVWEELGRLLSCYGLRQQGYAARRAVVSERQSGDYDHLARFGEWDMSDTPVAFDVGDGDG